MHVTGQCSQDKPTFSETVGTQCRFQNVLSVYAGQTPWKVYIYTRLCNSDDCFRATSNIHPLLRR